MALPENQIVHGDCVQILKTLPGQSVDLVVTDPPYLVNYRDRSGRTIKNDSSNAGILAAFSDAYRVLKPHSFCVSFYGWNRVDEFFGAWRRAGFRPVGHIVWQKDYASSSGFLQYQHEQAYLLIKGRPERPGKPIADVRPWAYSGNRTHPTEKAVSILKPLIEAFSKPGEIVLDPFSGSGSTAVAAALSGRRYIGIELEDRYCREARTRLAGAAKYAARKAA
jgi:DNA modification methylase